MSIFKRLFTGGGNILSALFSFVLSLVLDITLDNEVIVIISYSIALVIAGYSVFIDAVRGLIRRDFLDEKFLMSIASAGAMVIGEYTEGVFVMLFFLIGEYFEHLAINKSRSTIRSLMDICPDSATVLRDGAEEQLDADEVEIGDMLLIRDGERVAVDCEIVSGSADVDTSAITGEGMPGAAAVGDTVVSGSVILGGVITARALATADKSSAARILELVEEATERKSREENFISAFSRIYTPVVIALAVLLAFVPPLFGLWSLSDSVHRALSFLVISCPCALVVSVPLAFFAGIGSSASHGILFRGSLSFAPLARTDSAVFDKTGTLTYGELEIANIIPEEGIEHEYLLSLAASAEYSSNHPIARAVKSACPDFEIPSVSLALAGRGSQATVADGTVAIGNIRLMREQGVELVDDSTAMASVYVALNSKYIGKIELRDKIRNEAKGAIDELRRLGIKRFVMLSGDREDIANAVGASLGFDETAGGLLPEQKYERLCKIIEENDGGTMYVGDGINDAPSLALADVGIAMGGIGQDVAKEHSDVVIMGDNLERIPQAILIARKTLRAAKVNIVMAIGIKLAVLLLSAFGITNMLLAVFADVGVLLLAVLNSMRLLLLRKKV